MEPQKHSVDDIPADVAEVFSEAQVIDFESRLSMRTKVPAERLSDFLGWNETKVRQEAKVVSRILKRFAEAVVQSMDAPGSMTALLSTPAVC